MLVGESRAGGRHPRGAGHHGLRREERVCAAQSPRRWRRALASPRGCTSPPRSARPPRQASVGAPVSKATCSRSRSCPCAGTSPCRTSPVSASRSIRTRWTTTRQRSPASSRDRARRAHHRPLLCYHPPRPAGTSGWASPIERAAMKLHEYQAKQLLAAYGVPVPEKLRGVIGHRGGGSGGAARRHGRRQGAGARGRQRQGGRREGRVQPGGSRRDRRVAHRFDARDLPDGTAGRARPQGARRTDNGYRSRAVPEHHHGRRTAAPGWSSRRLRAAWRSRRSLRPSPRRCSPSL